MEILIGIDIIFFFELIFELDIFFMVLVGILIDDLFELKIDVQLLNEYEGDIEGWYICENMFCCGDVEGCFRSVLLYIVEKSYVGK